MYQKTLSTLIAQMDAIAYWFGVMISSKQRLIYAPAAKSIILI
jgi:hypothetical protein